MEQHTRREIKKIVVATGLSVESVGAVLQGQALAKRFGAELHVVHVAEPLSASEQKAIPGLADKHLQFLEEELANFAESHGLRGATSMRVLKGSAEAEILGLIKSLDADLLVVGRYGKGGLKHNRLGSIADRLVRKCPVSTLVVQPEFRGEFTSIGVACDLSGDSTVEIERALELGKVFGVKEVVLIHAFDVPHGYHTICTLEQAEANLTAVHTEQADRLVELARRKVPGVPPVRAVIRQGRVTKTVPEICDEEKISLLVVSTHERSGSAHLLLGRTTESILNNSTCSVWSETTPELFQGFLKAIKELLS